MSSNKRLSPFMNEFNPNNPYGYNYMEHSQTTKQYYKYTLVRKHVHLSEDDEWFIMKQGLILPIGVIASLVLAFGSTKLINNFIIPKIFPEQASQIQGLLSALACSASMTFSYFYLSEKFVNDVCVPITDKYKTEATKNGFEDYEISKTTDKLSTFFK